MSWAAFLYGAFPCNDLRHKFLLAKSSKVSEITKAILPNGIDIIDLPGHFFDMIGIRTSDGCLSWEYSKIISCMVKR
ncbi:hypothetical protein FMM82_10045 [[Clostridium] clostridioforme]|nr:hypothetical protein [Enterocloster clostridioformis]